MGPTIYSSVNILLNTTEYLKSQKAVLRRFVHFNNIVRSRKPFKGPQLLLQNSEHRGNESWTAVHMLYEAIVKSFCLRRWPAFSHESQMPDWVGLILGQIPHRMEQTSGMPQRGGGMGGFGT